MVLEILSAFRKCLHMFGNCSGCTIRFFLSEPMSVGITKCASVARKISEHMLKISEHVQQIVLDPGSEVF